MYSRIVRHALLATFALAPFALIHAPAAHAQGASVMKAFTGVEPKYNRPSGTTSLSGVGTAVPYVTIPFTVSTTGTYNLLYTANLTNTDTAAAYTDTILTIYSGAFNPASPLTNIVFYSDDFNAGIPGVPTDSSGSTGTTLNAGVNYLIVGTTFDNGTYTGTATATIGNITRPAGSVVVVPEAGSLPLFASGLLLPALGVLGLAVRKRRVN